MTASGYGVRSFILGSPGFLELTEPECKELLIQIETMADATTIEQKFDIMVENYRTFEEALLRMTTSYLINPSSGEFEARDVVNEINRHVVNLLSSCRLYVDHLKHHVSGMFGKQSEEYTKAGTILSKQEAASFAYRFMQALRNYVQH